MYTVKNYFKLFAVSIITLLFCFIIVNTAFAADDNSAGGLILEDYMNDFSKMDSCSQGLDIDTVSDPIYFEDDNSTLKSISGTPYIVYKRKVIKSFIMVAYFDPNQTMDHFKFYTSPDGVNYTEITPGTYNEGSDSGSWDRIIYSGSALSNADYLKVEWGSSASTAHISKIRIGYMGGMCFSDMGFESTTTSQLSTPGSWEVKYAKIESADVLNFNVSVQSSGGVPGGYLNIGENSPPSEGAVLVGQRVMLPAFFESADDILVEVDFQISSEAVNRSNVLRLVVLPEAYWDTLANDNSGATLYSSGNELYSKVLHNGFVDTDDVTEWMKATTKGDDITLNLSAYTGQTVVFVLKFETWYANDNDFCKLDNFEINMGELTNSRPHFVNIKDIRDKYFGYRWANKVVEGLKDKYDVWLNRSIELIPGSEVVWENRFVCPDHNVALVYEYKSYSDILATGKTYDTYYQAAEFKCKGIDPDDPLDDHVINYTTHPDHMETITKGWYASWMTDHTWAAYNLSNLFLITGNNAYAQKASEIVNEFAAKYPQYVLHDVVSPIRAIASKTFYSCLNESANFAVPLAFTVDNVYNSGVLTTLDKKAIRDDLLYPARDVLKRSAHESNFQVMIDTALGIIGYLYDDSAIIGEAKDGYYATAEDEDAMGMFNEILNYGVGDDGIWFEGTLSYHSFVLKYYTYMAEAAKRNGSNNNENLYYGNNKFMSMFEALINATYPDLTVQANNYSWYKPDLLTGVYPWFMETADREYNNECSKFREFLNEAYKNISRNDTSIGSLLFGYSEIPYTPYTLELKDENFTSWGNIITRDYSDANNKMMTTLDYGPYIGHHDHYDKLNITTYGNGRVWLDDLGHSAYNTESSNYYYANAAVHNTVVVPDSNQAGVNGRFVGIGNTKSMHISAASTESVFPNVEEYKRTLLMVKPFVVDIFKLRSTQNVTFDWFAHVPESTLSLSMATTPSSGSLGTNYGYQYTDILSVGNTNSTWSALFTDNANANSKYQITMLNDNNMTVYNTESFGKGFEPNDKIPVLVARKTVNGDSEFAALHEVINGSSQILSAQKDGNNIKVTMADGMEYYLQYDLEYALEESSFKLLKKGVSSNVLSIEVSNDNRFYIDNQQYLKSSNVISNISIVNTTNGTVDITHDLLDDTQKTDTELTFYVGSETINTVTLDGTSISFVRDGDYIKITAPLRAIPISRNQKVILNPSDDTYARQAEPDRVMGIYSTIVANNSNSDQVGYIKFDLSKYTGNDITSAKLRLYAYDNESPYNPVTIHVYGITDDTWNEGSLVWNNAPNIDTQGGDTVITGVDISAFLIDSISMENANYQWHEIDVTSFVKNHAFSDKNASFLIHVPSNIYGDWIFMSSKESGSKSPVLELEESREVTSTEAAYVQGGTSSGLNFGSDALVQVQDSTDASSDKLSYLKFDFDAYDSDRVGKAIINFYVSDMSATQSVPLTIYGIADDTWNETTMTWDTSPNHEASDTSVTGTGTTAFKIGTVYVDSSKYYRIDVTDFINTQMIDKIASFIITDESDSNVNIQVFSNDAVQNKPVLEMYKPIVNTVVTGDFIRGGTYADDNYAASNHLVIKNSSGVDSDRKTYVKIDLTDIKTRKVNKAVIRLRGYNSTSSVNTPVSVYGITDDTWTETGLTWNNAPNNDVINGAVTEIGTLAFLQDTVNVNDVVGYYEFDITDFIYSQLGQDNYASLVFAIESEYLTSYVDFNSDETTYPPELVLEY